LLGAGVTLILGRSEEQARFRAVLPELREGGLPDEAHVVLVYGLGGIGKSTLLRRYGEIAAEDAQAATGRGKRGLLAASVDWESEQRLRAADFVLDGGPPVWVVLDRIYRALGEAAGTSKRDTAFTEKTFGPFRLQVTHLPELAEDVRRTFPGGEPKEVTSAADIEAVLQAIGRGAAVAAGAHPAAVLAAAPAAKGVAGAGHLARDAWGAFRQRRHGPVPEQAYRLVLRRVEELVDTFARCLRRLSDRRPVMIMLDTCELIPGSQEYLRRAMRASGPRVLWVIGMRLDPDPEFAGQVHGEVARYRQAIRDSRLRVAPLGRFSDDTISEYFDRELPGRLGADVPPHAVARVTRGIPLAVSLVCDLLKAGQDAEAALRPVPEPGKPSAVVRWLAERYLIHALTCAPLRADVPMLYGLALLHSDRLDPDLLAALWDIDPGEVAEKIAGLAARHDFVLYGTRRLHDDVRDAVRLHLLDDALRIAQRPMNQRAAAHLSRRLTGLRLTGIEAQLASEEWQSLATALLWHTFWAGNRAGIDLLCDLLPAAGVLAEPFGVALLDVAQFFLPVLNSQEKRTVTVLAALVRLSLRRPGAGTTPGGEESRDALAVLENRHDLEGSVLAADNPRAVYLSLLAAKYAWCVADPPEDALKALEHAAGALPGPHDLPGATSRALARLAERLANDMLFVTPWKLRASPGGLRATELATRHNPASSTAWWLLAVARCELGDYEGDLAASEEAIRLDPGLALAHNSRGVALARSGRFQEAWQEYDEAVRLAPDYVVAQTNRAGMLARFGRLQEALDASEEAIRLQPRYAPARSSRARALRLLGRFQDSLNTCDEAFRIDPESVPAHNGRGLALHYLGQTHDALDAFGAATRLDPADAWAHANRSLPLRRLGRFHDALDACDTAVRLDPGNSWAHVHRGLALQALGRIEDALDAHDNAIRIDPGDDWPHTSRAKCLITLGRPAEARASLQHVIELSPADAPEARVLLAALLRHSDPSQSARLARAALTDPGKFESPFRRGELKAIAYLLLASPENAQAELRAAAPMHSPGDLFEDPLYGPLHDPPVTGLDQFLATWEDINPATGTEH
jgi:tetratricopeptide (TPR) repeat protein